MLNTIRLRNLPLSLCINAVQWVTKLKQNKRKASFSKMRVKPKQTHTRDVSVRDYKLHFPGAVLLLNKEYKPECWWEAPVSIQADLHSISSRVLLLLSLGWRDFWSHPRTCRYMQHTHIHTKTQTNKDPNTHTHIHKHETKHEPTWKPASLWRFLTLAFPSSFHLSSSPAIHLSPPHSLYSSHPLSAISICSNEIFDIWRMPLSDGGQYILQISAVPLVFM